jgi:hypothetical protein
MMPHSSTGAYRCRNRIHQELFHAACWHGTCPICRQGVTAFDFSESDAQEAIDRHIKENHG